MSDGFEIDVGSFVNNDGDDHGVEGETSFTFNVVNSVINMNFLLILRMIRERILELYFL